MLLDTFTCNKMEDGQFSKRKYGCLPNSTNISMRILILHTILRPGLAEACFNSKPTATMDHGSYRNLILVMEISRYFISIKKISRD